jgi:DNA mismatch endonuclease, patch repair protein
MVDIISRQRRSTLMSRIRSKNTKPEIIVRKLVHSLGYRFRLHVKELPGCPDIVFPSRKKIIMVHGCFWHRHKCSNAFFPKTRAAFWGHKFDSNVKRDQRVRRKLAGGGWKILVIWECQTELERLSTRVKAFLDEPI